MYKRFLFSVSGFMTFVLFISTFQLLYAGSIFDKKEPVKVEIAADRMIYPLGDEVVMTVYLKNTTDETLELTEPAIDKRSLYFEITMPDGKKDKLLDIYGLSLERIKLPPKKRFKFTARFTPETCGNFTVDVFYYGFEDRAIKGNTASIYVVNKLK